MLYFQILWTYFDLELGENGGVLSQDPLILTY